MKNLFLTEEDIFEINIFAAEDDDGSICCDITEDGVKALLGNEDIDIQHFSVIFKKPSFGDLINLTEILLSARIYDTDVVNYEINPISARLKVMSSLIKSWNLTGEDGEIIEPNEGNLKKLNPTVATAISLQLEDYLNVDKKISNLIQSHE